MGTVAVSSLTSHPDGILTNHSISLAMVKFTRNCRGQVEALVAWRSEEGRAWRVMDVGCDPFESLGTFDHSYGRCLAARRS